MSRRPHVGLDAFEPGDGPKLLWCARRPKGRPPRPSPGRDHRVGYRLGVPNRSSLDFDLGVDAQRRECAMVGRPATGPSATRRWAGDPLADWKRRLKAVTKHTRGKRDRRRARTAKRSNGAQPGASASPAENEPQSEAEPTGHPAGDERTENAPETPRPADAHELPSVALTTRFLSLCQRYGSEQLAVRIVAAGRSTGIPGLPPSNDWTTWNAYEMRAAIEHLKHKLGR